MKKSVFLIISILMFGLGQLIFAENDGRSVESAIIIKNISNYEKCRTDDDISQEYRKSIDQERKFIDEKYGIRGKDWEYGMQALMTVNKRHYDQQEIILLDSKNKKVMFFDVTEPLEMLDRLEEKRIKSGK